MPIVRKQIKKSFLLLCEGKDEEQFLINYLNSGVLARDQRFSNVIQVLDFGGNEELTNFLTNLKNMDKYNQVTSIAIIRDAESNYDSACKEVCGSLLKCGFKSPEKCGTWVSDGDGPKIGYILFPLDNGAGTLEDLCIRILSEKSDGLLSLVDSFLTTMESFRGKKYRRKHKNMIHTYLASSDKYVAMPIGVASSAGAFDWGCKELGVLEQFLIEGF